MPRKFLALATIAAALGAAGVALAASATHSGGGELGRTASLFLILHAAALLGVSALAGVQRKAANALLSVGAALAIGVLLFSTDLATRAFTGDRLFPFAAPIGGSLMIIGWLALALVCARAAWQAVDQTPD
jgi:uncharacterized membrane protein YgdD (TMEM256/DUF423 family)